MFAYDLDFPDGLTSVCDTALTERGREAPAAPLDIASVVGAAKAHILFSREQLLMELPVLFPAEQLIVGVPECDLPDEELLGTCGRLASLGYQFTVPYSPEGVLGKGPPEFPAIVRIHGTRPEPSLAEVCRQLQERGQPILADHLERGSEYSEAAALGCRYFEGDFYRRPKRRTSRNRQDPPLSEAQHLRLLERVNRTDQPLEELEALISQDVTLTFRLLRFVNSAWFGFRQAIQSIHHALVLLGPPEIRKWASTLVLNAMGGDKPRELFRRSLIRAHLAECVALESGKRHRGSEAFLMGMFSLADALTDTPLERLLNGLPLSKDITTALLAERGELGPICRLVAAYEQGHWADVRQAAPGLGLDAATMPGLFATASRWADEAMASM